MPGVLRNSVSLPALILTLVIIALLAALQYRWINRVAESERLAEAERIRDALGKIAADFDREITRVHFAFLPDWEDPEHPEVALSARMKEWTALAPWPKIVSAVQIALRDGETRRITRDGDVIPVLNARGGMPPPPPIRRGPGMHVVEFEGSPALAIPFPLRRREGPPPFPGRARPPGPPRELHREPGIRLVLLDTTELRDGMLRNLITRHLGFGRYDLEVRRRDQILFRTGDAVARDAESASILAIRPDCLFEMDGSPGPPGPGFPGRPVRVRPGNDVLRIRGATCGPARAGAQGYWTLAAQPGSGSLTEAVGAFRMRSLTLSFSILGLLTASVIALWLSVNRARSLAQRQLEFAMSASHELRTPLTVMRLAGDNLASGVAVTPEQTRRYGETVRREAERLSGMVDQLLLFARAHRAEGVIQTTAVTPESLIDSALEAAQPALAEAGMEVVREIEPGLPPVRADANLLTAALANLLTNAAAYASSGKWVRIRASVGKDVALEVSDRGDGVPRQDLRRIFEPCYRGQNAAATRGAGLGLHLVKRIVEAHGGRVSAASDPGMGLTVRLELPAAGEVQVAQTNTDRGR